MTIRRKLLLVIALLVAFASGSSARAQAPGSLQKSNASVAIGASTSTVPQLAHQEGYPDLPPVEFDLDLGEFIDGIYVMPPSTWLYAMVDRPKRGSARLLFYLNGSCTEPREDAYNSDALSYYNRQNGFAASIRARYSFTLDDGTYISSYLGPCIPILWDTEKYYGVGARQPRLQTTMVRAPHRTRINPSSPCRTPAPVKTAAPHSCGLASAPPF